MEGSAGDAVGKGCKLFSPSPPPLAQNPPVRTKGMGDHRTGDRLGSRNYSKGAASGALSPDGAGASTSVGPSSTSVWFNSVESGW